MIMYTHTCVYIYTYIVCDMFKKLVQDGSKETWKGEGHEMKPPCDAAFSIPCDWREAAWRRRLFCFVEILDEKKRQICFVHFTASDSTSWIFVDSEGASGYNKLELSTTKLIFDSSPSVTAPRVFCPAKSFPASLCCGRHSWTLWASNCARKTNHQFFSAVPDQFWNKLGTW